MKTLGAVFVAFLFAAFADAADPWVVSPELPATAATYGTSLANSRPSVAASTDNFLAAWTNRAAGLPQQLGLIHMMPFDAAGRPQRPLPMPLDVTFGDPAVASNGSEYLVAWTEDGGILTQRVAKNGSLIGSILQAVSASPSTPPRVPGKTRLAWNGARYVAAVNASVRRLDGTVSTSVIASLIDPNKGGQRILLDNDGDIAGVAVAGGRALITWMKSATLKGAFLDDSGDLSPAFTIDEDTSAASIASNGTEFLVLATTRSGPQRLQVLRVTIDGFVPSVNDMAVFAKNDVDLFPPAVTWDGRRFVAIWTASALSGGTTFIPATSIAEVSFTSAGTAVTIGHSIVPALDGANGVTALVWLDGNAVRGQTFTATTINLPNLLSSAPRDQYSPRAILNRDSYLVFFVDRSDNGGLTLRVSPTTLDGRHVNADGIALSTGSVSSFDAVATPAAVVAASVEKDSSNTEQVVVRRVLNDGQVAGNELRLPAATPQSGGVSLAWSGSMTYLAWARDGQVHGARISAAGEILEPNGVQLSNRLVQAPYDPHVVWLGERFLVLWAEQTPDLQGTFVKSAIVAPEGARSSERLAFTIPQGGVTISAVLPVAGNRVIVSWISSSDLHLAVIDVNGTLVGNPLGNPLHVNPLRAVLLPAGNQVQVVWTEAHEGSADVMRAVIASDLSSVSTPARLFTIGAVPGDLDVDASAGFPRLVAYSRADLLQNGAHRVFLRLITTPRRRAVH